MAREKPVLVLASPDDLETDEAIEAFLRALMEEDEDPGDARR